MEKKPIVKIRLYRGRELNYNFDGSIKNENDLVSLEHNSRQWAIFMNNIAISGYCKAEVEKAFKVVGKGEYEPIKELSDFQKEVDGHFEPRKEEVQTPDSKRIAELEAKLELLLSGKTLEKEVEAKPKAEVKVETLDKSDLTEKIDEKSKESIKKEPSIADLAVRDKYIEVFGKNPFNGWSTEVMKEKIKEELGKRLKEQQ